MTKVSLRNVVMIQLLLVASLLFGQFQYELDRDGYSYYGPISANNLFRPLGWKKPDSSPRYELLATVIGKDKKYFKAYIRDVRNDRDYFVSVGDSIGDSVVQRIGKRLVTLDDDTEFIAKSFGFLNVIQKGSRSRKTGAVSTTDSTTIPSKTSGEHTQEPETVRQGTRRRTEGGQWQARMSQFQNASPEERQTMIEQFRQMRGNRGGGRGRRNRGN